MAEPHLRQAIIRVPATSANLGPGFDCLGMAVDLWNETIVSVGNPSIEVSGEGADILPKNETNLIFQSAEKTFQELQIDSIPLQFACKNEIPLSRGLGSSSAATLTGIAAAFAFAGFDVSEPNSKRRIFGIAAEIERHPDNVAPAVYGGCQIGINVGSGSDSDNWVVSRVNNAEELKAIVFIPDFPMPTEEARGILSPEIPRSDAVFNIGRAAMLVHALETRQWDLLLNATDDRLHQPQRIARLFPMFRPIARGAIEGGAHGVFLSGAGPTVMALASERFMTICYEMSENARKGQIDGKAMVLDITGQGISVSDML